MSNSYLVEEIRRRGSLNDPRLLSAFSFIDRVDFVRSSDLISVYLDEPLAIGYGQTISQPSTVALMLEWLELRPGHKVLDVGSGSGWQTSLIAFLVSRGVEGDELPPVERGQVFGLELIPELATWSVKNISKYNFISSKVVQIHCLNASKGYQKEAPYDRIISAASGSFIPDAWKEQLAVGGIIISPIGNDLIKLTKISFNEFKSEKKEGFLFVPFVS